MLCHQDSSFNFFAQESTKISYLYFLKLGGVRIYDILVELDIVFFLAGMGTFWPFSLWESKKLAHIEVISAVFAFEHLTQMVGDLIFRPDLKMINPFH